MGTSPFAEQHSELSNAGAKAGRASHCITVRDSHLVECRLAASNPSAQVLDNVAADWCIRGGTGFSGSSSLHLLPSRPAVLAVRLVTSQPQDPNRPGASICVR
jgi:hypothetical protein